MAIDQPKRKQHSTVVRIQHGLTILEMLIVLAILAIVVTVVAPNMQGILVKNKIVAQLNELSAVVQYARNTAIDEQATTIFCPSSDLSACSNNWDQPKMVFVDENENNLRDADEALLAATGKVSAVNRVSGPENPIRFFDNGSTSSPASLLLCHQSNDDHYARAISISLQGRVKVSADSNNNGIHETPSGDALSCS